MNVEFFFHGTPSAFQVWGTAKDNNDLKRFYQRTALEEQTRFIIELSTLTDGSYCAYYTLLKAKKIYDYTGRSGSYFGLTIRFDGDYCLDVEEIFSICVSVYENDICGKITQRGTDSTKYLVQNFNNHESYLKRLSEQIANSISSLRYSNIKSDLIDNRGVQATPQSINLSEVGSRMFWESLKKSQKIFISAEYPTKDDSISKLQKQLEEEYKKTSELKKNADFLQQKYADCSKESAKNQQIIHDLRDENQNLKEKLKLHDSNNKNKLRNDFNSELQKIKDPLNRIVDFLTIAVSEDDKKESNVGNRLKGFLYSLKHISASTVISSFCLLFLVLLFLMQTSVIKISDHNDNVTSLIEERTEDFENVKIIPDNDSTKIDSVVH